jgi:hypothetical protein
MPATYEPIATTTLGSSQSSVTFSSFSGYTDLVLQMNTQGVAGSGSGANTVFLEFNADTASNYSRTSLLADSGGAQSIRNSSQTKMTVGNGYESATLSSIYATFILNIQNYANTTTFKTVVGRYSSNGDRVGAIVGLWRKTPEAITSIKITCDSSTGNFATGSTFTLYGIKAA